MVFKRNPNKTYEPLDVSNMDSFSKHCSFSKPCSFMFAKNIYIGFCKCKRKHLHLQQKRSKVNINSTKLALTFRWWIFVHFTLTLPSPNIVPTPMHRANKLIPHRRNFIPWVFFFLVFLAHWWGFRFGKRNPEMKKKRRQSSVTKRSTVEWAKKSSPRACFCGCVASSPALSTPVFGL